MIDKLEKSTRHHITKADHEVIKLFFMLNSTEHENYHARKCLNANDSWHFNIYLHD